MREQKHTVGIIGCGTVTQKSYVPTFLALPSVYVKYVYDLNTKSAEEVSKAFNSEVSPLHEFKNKVDIIIIATPPHTHVSLIADSLAERKIVVCEKPFVGRRLDADYLLKIASDRKSKLYVAHFRRVFPHVQLVRSLTATGVLGNVTSLSIIEGGRFSWETHSGYVMNDPFGGVLFDTGSHTIDMTLYAAMLDEGKFTASIESLKRDKSEPSHEIQASFLFDCEGGRGRGYIHFSRFQILANIITIRYERGVVQFSPGLLQRVRVMGEKGTSIIFPEFAATDYSEPFALQYQKIISGNGAEIFDASRFCNLTSLLELIANG